MYTTSIIIPVFNRWNFTASCLNALINLDATTNEIIIIDNASTDETKTKIQDYLTKYSNIKYIKNDTNKFHSEACNQGYAIASSENIIFLNNDIRVKGNIEDWTKQVGVAIGLNPNCIFGPVGGAIDPKTCNFLYETRTDVVNYISGWCLFGNKKTFDKLKINNYTGPWSNDFPFYYNDTDMGFRAKTLGINMILFDLPLVHLGKASSNQLNINKLYNEGKQTFIKKWKK
jgi:GT2 family glycosyltransferase